MFSGFWGGCFSYIIVFKYELECINPWLFTQIVSPQILPLCFQSDMKDTIQSFNLISFVLSAWRHSCEVGNTMFPFRRRFSHWTPSTQRHHPLSFLFPRLFDKTWAVLVFYVVFFVLDKRRLFGLQKPSSLVKLIPLTWDESVLNPVRDKIFLSPFFPKRETMYSQSYTSTHSSPHLNILTTPWSYLPAPCRTYRRGMHEVM